MYFMLEKNKFSYTATRAEKLGKTPHLHSQIELILVTSGESEGFADDKSVLITAGDLFIAFPNQVHYYLDRTRVEHGRILVSPELCPEFSRLFKNFVPQSPVLKNAYSKPMIRSSVDNIISCYSKTDEFAETEVRGSFLILFSEIFRNTELRENLHCDTDTVKEIITYCYENYTSDISLDDIASALHISKYYVSHLFGKRLHISFTDYINTLRITHACELLKKSESTVSEIAYEVGYNSIRTFNRAFLSARGMTPREYRNA